MTTALVPGITGGVKFFEPSLNLSADGATATATSGDSSSLYALDRNKDTRWRTVGSDDLTTETYELTFPDSTTFTRLLLLDINWKAFDVMYDVAGVWTHFSSVYGMDGSKTNITETVFADSSAYYKFASVTTTKLRIRVTSTQTANEEKYLAQIICTTELGTLEGFPEINQLDVDRNSRVAQTLSGKYVVQKGLETAGFRLDFKNYPRASTYNADMDLMMTLFDRETPFLVWLCGGRRGSTYFGYTLRGFRLQDVYLMQITKAFKLKYTGNLYKAQVNCQVDLEEHI